jgi:hypothetical protein
MRSYDMWGTDQEGLATFKASFGGEERRWIGAWQLVTDAAGYRALKAVSGLRATGSGIGRRLAALPGRAAPRREPAAPPA